MEKENDKKNKEDLTSSSNGNEEKIVEVEKVKELTLEEKLEETQDKLLRALADSENQRRRSEKETKEVESKVDAVKEETPAKEV